MICVRFPQGLIKLMALGDLGGTGGLVPLPVVLVDVPKKELVTTQPQRTEGKPVAPMSPVT